MKRNTKIKNKNSGYFLIAPEVEGNRIFDKIGDAERYCHENSLDPNEFIISETPESFETCQRIALSSISALQALREVLRGELLTAREKIKMSSKDNEEHGHELGGDYYREKLVREIGEHTGIADAIIKLDEELIKYENIRRLSLV